MFSPFKQIVADILTVRLILKITHIRVGVGTTSWTVNLPIFASFTRKWTVAIDVKSFFYLTYVWMKEGSLGKLRLFSACRVSYPETVLTLLMNGDFHETWSSCCDFWVLWSFFCPNDLWVNLWGCWRSAGLGLCPSLKQEQNWWKIFFLTFPSPLNLSFLTASFDRNFEVALFYHFLRCFFFPFFKKI